MKRTFAPLLGAALALAVLSPAHGAERTVLKFAGLAPEGTSFMEITHRWMDAVAERSDGRLKIVFYPGGVMGDEPDIIRKIRLGQLQGAGVTGLGVGTAAPAVRVLEQPMLFESYEQVDEVREAVEPELEAAFRRSGFTLLSWAELGFVHLYSDTRLERPEDLTRKRMWVWQADPVAEAIGSALPEIISVPLSVPEMIGAVNSGNVHMMYSSPLAVVAAGLHTQLQYMLETPIAYGTGAVLVANSAYDRLDPELQRILRSTSREILPAIIPETRRQNREAISGLAAHGVEMLDPEPRFVRHFRERLEPVRHEFVGEMYSEDLLRKVERAAAGARGELAATTTTD